MEFNMQILPLAFSTFLLVQSIGDAPVVTKPPINVGPTVEQSLFLFVDVISFVQNCADITPFNENNLKGFVTDLQEKIKGTPQEKIQEAFQADKKMHMDFVKEHG